MDFSLLRSLDEELLGSATRHDPDRLRELLHPHFTEIGRSGRQWSRDEIVESLASESERAPVVTADWQFSELAPGVALVCYTVRAAEGDSRHSSVWVLDGHKPRLRFHQGTFIATQ
ncbi:nuclear transport factor 2 family protein [Microbacterium sp. NPDC019599]|uniref:nuclear transport factor 2 family protein n=1 Tax=Microbacterium sp. NPDC019599 TaxID=3154690 RepID=UPI0034006600